MLCILSRSIELSHLLSAGEHGSKSVILCVRESLCEYKRAANYLHWPPSALADVLIFQLSREASSTLRVFYIMCTRFVYLSIYVCALELGKHQKSEYEADKKERH